jgi:tripartite motif-containing protein 2/3
LPCICAFSFALFLSSCVTTHSLSPVFEKDIFIDTLTAQMQFGNFIDAQAMSIDAFGNIYVADRGAPGIFKFNLHGDSIRAVVGFGKEHDQFDGPVDVDASLTNSVAVVDRNNHRIEIYSKDLIWQAGINGHETGSKIQFGYPLEVRAAAAGNYFIIDGENKRALSIQPANGSQQVITISGTESGAEMNPVSLALGENEFATIADANSLSLIVFNNAYLPQAKVRYLHAYESKLSASENFIYAYEAGGNSIRVFDAANLGYQGSLALPKEVNHLIAFCVYKGDCYILTKEKIVVCSRN